MDEMVIPIVAILMPLALVPTIITLKHKHARREWEHKERMRSLELGLPPSHVHPWPAATSAIAIGLGVPLAAFFFSWLAVETAHAADEVFIGATFVGMTGVIVGGRLAGRLLPGHAPAIEPEATTAPINGKPAFDPDTFDVVGRRG